MKRTVFGEVPGERGEDGAMLTLRLTLSGRTSTITGRAECLPRDIVALEAMTKRGLDTTESVV